MKTKTNYKFLSVVLSILLAAALLLLGCMHLIGRDKGDSKPYDMAEDVPEDYSQSLDDVPVTQLKLQKKFSQMYRFNRDGDAITVIAVDFLYNYWKGNYDSEEIRSLSVEDVRFIVEDSIRIYHEYEKILLPGFDITVWNPSIAEEVAARFPKLEEKMILGAPAQEEFDYALYKQDIYDIVFYRVAALSSPKAFLYEEEAYQYAGMDPASIDNGMPKRVIYIPDYSAETDKEILLHIMSNSQEPLDLQKWIDYFDLSSQITFRTLKNNANAEVIFPTENERNYEIMQMQAEMQVREYDERLYENYHAVREIYDLLNERADILSEQEKTQYNAEIDALEIEMTELYKLYKEAEKQVNNYRDLLRRETEKA